MNNQKVTSGFDPVALTAEMAAANDRTVLDWVRELIEADVLVLLEKDIDKGYREYYSVPPGAWSPSIVRRVQDQAILQIVTENDYTARRHGLSHVFVMNMDPDHVLYIGWSGDLPYDLELRLKTSLTLVTTSFRRVQWTRMLGQSSRALLHLRERVSGVEMVTLDTGETLVWRSEAYGRLVREVVELAAEDVSVLFLGETGVGKTLLARWLHQQSPRNNFPFIHVVVPSIPGELLAASLFGAMRGAYTDAVTDIPGYLAMAEGGTLFLDEIAEIAPSTQAVLLNVVEQGTYYVLGETKSRTCNVRWVSATHQPRQLRPDLKYRIAEETLPIPPLRERPQDIVPIFLLHADVIIEPEAEQVLERYEWPGNQRQLVHLARSLGRKHRQNPQEPVTAKQIQQELERRQWEP